MSFSSRVLTTMAAAASSSVAFATSRQECAQEATHLIVLVHGWMGNAQEMSYMKESIERAALNYPEQKFVVVSPTMNEGRTHDGIAAGGERLSEEVSKLIAEYQNENTMTTLSFVGNSLGGLYSRFALSKLDLDQVKPLVFCTTATPHLGVSKHTYVPLPSWGEYAVAHILRPTGKDLFNVTPMIEEMAFESIYTAPLRKFRKRIAYANAFGTDFQVPTCTAAFLCPESPHPHIMVDGEEDDISDDEHVVLTVETKQDPKYETTLASSVGHALDMMGWRKVFCDLRDKIPLPSMPRIFSSNTDIPKQHNYTANELIPLVTSGGSRWNVPLGHQVLVANSKDGETGWYTKMSAGGRPLVDRMASDLVNDIVKYTKEAQEQEQYIT